MSEGLVFVGRIVNLEPIPSADAIMSATVVCGKGGKWRGVVRKEELRLGDRCIVYLPDSLLPESDEMRFMERHKWRVKICRFRGAPSEVLIMPMPISDSFVWEMPTGSDVTEHFGVKKYCKPIPSSLQGIAKGDFPSFIPKTDEPNYQSNPELVNALHGKPYYMSEKVDGSSTTAFSYNGEFGVCSRNLELLPDENNGYWKVARKYQLEERLPEGVALQWETCGPKIQGNPLGLTEIDGRAFSAYDVKEKRYFTMAEFFRLCQKVRFPTCRFLGIGYWFDKSKVETLGEGKYANGKEREGVVVRSLDNALGCKPISFKVINLNYEK